MLQSKRGSPWIAVSPDAIVVGTVNSRNGLPQEVEEQILFVELKTQQKMTQFLGKRSSGTTWSISFLQLW